MGFRGTHNADCHELGYRRPHRRGLWEHRSKPPPVLYPEIFCVPSTKIFFEPSTKATNRRGRWGHCSEPPPVVYSGMQVPAPTLAKCIYSGPIPPVSVLGVNFASQAYVWGPTTGPSSPSPTEP